MITYYQKCKRYANRNAVYWDYWQKKYYRPDSLACCNAPRMVILRHHRAVAVLASRFAKGFWETLVEDYGVEEDG